MLKHFLSLLLIFFSASFAHAQSFDRLYGKSAQPVLSQPLQWVSALPSAAPSLPEGFTRNPENWDFAPYTSITVLPTSKERDAWVKFSLAATPTPQNWIIRIPRVTVQRVSLYAADANGFGPVQSAGALIPPAQWNRTTRTPSFEVLTSNTEQTYYLRFEHHTALTERPELMSSVDFSDGAARVGTLIGMMFGMFGLLMVACVAAYAMARNSVFLALAAFAVAMLLQHLVALGYGGWRMWPSSVYLNQVMQWAAPMLALSAGCWFFAQASYAKDTHKRIYQLLVLLGSASACLGLLTFFAVGQLPRSLLNGWSAFVVVALMLSLLWLSVRGLRWNLWLLAGLLPLAGSAASRLIYSYGWLAHIEFAQSISVLLVQLGLLVFFLALCWRSRDALLSKELGKVLANNDPATGLFQQRVAKIRMTQMLLRAARLKMGCGVIMLRWVNYSQIMGALSPERQEALLKQMGLILARVVRDVDTAAVLGEGYFLVLVEGPVNRSSLSSLATQILTACLRTSEKLDLPSSLKLHIAIWQDALVPSTTQEVIEALQTRLNQMSAGTTRLVQFADSANSDPGPEQDEDIERRRDEIIAKINSIEATPGLHMPAIILPDRKSR